MSKFYIPIMKTLQAEQLALRSLSPEKKLKIRPLLQYVSNKRLEPILEENPDINFFLEFPPLSFNRDVLTLEIKEETFRSLKTRYSNFTPVISVFEEENPRNLVQHTLRLLKDFGEVLIKTELLGQDRKIDNYKFTCLVALYSCVPLEQTYFLIDFGYVVSSEPFEQYLSVLDYTLQDAQWGFSATIWPPTQKDFEKMKVHYLKNLPFIYYLRVKDKVAFYSDYLTDNLFSPIVEEGRPLTIVPYFKLTSLDGKYGLIVRAESKEAIDVKETAQMAVEEYGFVHDYGCLGCDELKKIADTSTDAVGNPMSRKKLSFVHHLEVISALI